MGLASARWYKVCVALYANPIVGRQYKRLPAIVNSLAAESFFERRHLTIKLCADEAWERERGGRGVRYL